MIISSPAFQAGGDIPSEFTCEGTNTSIPLEWSSIPKNTKSLALIMDDPDAPVGIFVHWVVYNIPPAVSGFPKDLPNTQELEDGIRQGTNDTSKTGYCGPCPPSGTHRYFFKLYALDCMLKPKDALLKSDLLKAMEGHIIENTEMIGLYKRKG
jgi:Raf kinase inhibitor-like YbhB/YbcL family protein